MANPMALRLFQQQKLAPSWPGQYNTALSRCAQITVVMALTPCIGVCSTGIGDTVCRGCKRFAQEVIHWNGYSKVEQQAVLSRIDAFIAQAARNRLEIVDQELLAEKMRYQQIRFESEKDPYCWLFNLLRRGAGQIGETEEFGFHRRPQWRNHALPDIKEEIEKESYELSCAYYQRYILPAAQALEESL